MLKEVDSDKYTEIFGTVPTSALEIELMGQGATKLCANVVYLSDAETLAVVLWSRFYEKWALVRTKLTTDNMDYTITTDNKSNTTNSTGDTINGFNDDTPVPSQGSDETSIVNSTKTVTYKGRNGGNALKDFSTQYRLQTELTGVIIHDILKFVTIPMY